MGDVINAVGDIFGFGPASKAADATRYAADVGAAGAAEAARIAADAAKFRPYNITTALGGVRFGDQTANINYNPELAAYRDRLFGLARSTIPMDIRAAEEDEYRRLVEGSRGALEQQTAALGTGLFRTGRQGLDIFGANPEMRAFAAGLSDRELALRQAAEQQIANRIAQSTGLFTSGVGVEQAMLQPLEIGAQLGGRSAAAGAVAADALLKGNLAATQARSQGILQSGLMSAQSQQGMFSALPTWKQFTTLNPPSQAAPIYTATPQTPASIYNLQDFSGGYSPY